jgi:chromosome segregation ATPase
MHRIKQIICLSTLFTFLAIPNICLSETSDNVVTDDNIGRLAAAVEGLTQLLTSQATVKNEDKELRKLDIAISYLNFRSRRIEMMDRDLSMTRNERDRIEVVIQQWQERREILVNNLEDKPEGQRQKIEQTLQDLEVRSKTYGQRLTKLEEDIIIQENQVSDLQSELDSIESYVKQHLQM